MMWADDLIRQIRMCGSFLILLAAVFPWAAPASDIVILDIPKISSRDGHALYDPVVSRVFADEIPDLALSYKPIRRAIAEYAAGKAMCIFPVGNLPEAEGELSVTVNFFSFRYYHLNSREFSARKSKLAVLKVPEIEEIVSDMGLKPLVSLSNYGPMVRLLESGRVDAVLAPYPDFAIQGAEAGLADLVTDRANIHKQQPDGFLCDTNRARGRHLLSIANRQLAEMTLSGELKLIFGAYYIPR